MRKNDSLFWLTCLVISFLSMGCPEDGAGAGGTPCQLASDCPEGNFCNADGFCEEGYAEGTCGEDSDCFGEEICVKAEGIELGTCVNPHDCDEDADCNDPDKICVDADNDGYRDCVYDGCTDDSQCEEDLDNCPISDRPRCIAGACICVDYCGAPCGEGLVCCAPPSDIAQCIPDPGACSDFSCERGLHGEVLGTTGPFSPTDCAYIDTDCSCVENDPLTLETFGYPHALLIDSEGQKHLLTYNVSYGDVMFSTNVPNQEASFDFVTGVPEATDENVTGSLTGPRGGVSEPGDDIGNNLDAILDSSGKIHAVWRNATSGDLEYGTLKENTNTWVIQPLDTQGDCGYSAQIQLVSDTRLLVSHVAIDEEETSDAGVANDLSKSTLRILALTLSDTSFTTVFHDGYSRNVPDEGGSVTTEDRLALSETDMVWNGSDIMIFGHHSGYGELWAIQQTSGDLFSEEAEFSDHVIIDNAISNDPGHNPSAASLTEGGFLVLTNDHVKREISLTHVGADASVITSEIVDDGQVTASTGATNGHPMNTPHIVLDTAGNAHIAYTDGTIGNLYYRKRAADGTLDVNATTLLNATDTSDVFQGHYGFHVEGAYHNNKVSFSAVRLNAQGSRFSDIVIVDVAAP